MALIDHSGIIRDSEWLVAIVATTATAALFWNVTLAWGIVAVGYVGFCSLAAWRRHMLLWSCACLLPLTCAAWMYLDSVPIHDDPFGERWLSISVFTSVAILTGATGTLSMVSNLFRRP